ncbi:MAG: sigma-70 family RNA polymerase sigma factor [Calditrichaceae bacterium]
MTGQIDQIYKQFYSQLLVYIKKRIPDSNDAEDILQSVYVKLLMSADKLRDKDKLAGWIYAIAHNAVMDYYRNKRISVEKIELDELPEIDESDDHDNTNEIYQCVLPFINQLNEKYRKPLLLADVENKSMYEISLATGISVTAVKSRVQRARMMVRELFLECCRITYDSKGKFIDYTPHGSKEEDCNNCRNQ